MTTLLLWLLVLMAIIYVVIAYLRARRFELARRRHRVNYLNVLAKRENARRKQQIDAGWHDPTLAYHRARLEYAARTRSKLEV